jgi:hypothetical protein
MALASPWPLFAISISPITSARSARNAATIFASCRANAAGVFAPRLPGASNPPPWPSPLK